MEVTFGLSLLCLLLAIGLKLLRQPKKNLPPGPPGLPIIGHLHLLKNPIHRRFHKLSQKYGPVMSLRFGSRFVVVVSTPEAVEECFSKNDVVLANRPPFLNGKYLNYNFTTLASAGYGDHWRNLRRLSSIEIFSATRLKSFLDIRKDEVMHLVSRLHHVSKDGFAKVELRSLFLDETFNVIMRMMAGKRYFGENVDGAEEAAQFKQHMQDYTALTKVTNLGDLFPLLGFIDIGGLRKKMIDLSEKFDLFLQRIIDEHRSDKTRNSMVSHLLQLQETQPEYYSDAIIKGLILVITL
ncbi:hypothetical protein Tsubulata_038107 [Turnera subulata]|uniref:Cytochrome P450 n=1 Tax=Turnera subulata TaxID=218843 RepID=A0A9Q0F8E9_9ROSI|nr:hypothetical protein Tsubulata_038107 [Turnera subulata]